MQKAGNTDGDRLFTDQVNEFGVLFDSPALYQLRGMLADLALVSSVG